MPQEFKPPSGPPPGYYNNRQQNAYTDVNQQFQPPPGPPPSYHASNNQQQTTFADANQQFEPPPGPPPTAPPEYAPWLAVPDTSLLPPAPTVNHVVSPTANATAQSADQGKDWCRYNRLFPPGHITSTDRDNPSNNGYRFPTERSNNNTFAKLSPNFTGELINRQFSTWLVRTKKKNQDCSLLTTIPLYSAFRDDPLRNHGKSSTIYFEMRVLRMGSEDSDESEEAEAGIAIGYAAPPYPPFRLPGWERASLGVHGDDGRRYVDDDGGGQDFTTYFKNGETVGIGMCFKAAQFQGRKRDVDVFFTREGEKVGSWSLYEERDSDDPGSVAGLEGDHDLCAAVGMFGQVEFEVRFRRDEWLYRP